MNTILGEDITREILDISRQLTPYLVLKDSSFSPIYLIILPVLIKIFIPNVIKFIKKLFNNEKPKESYFVDYFAYDHANGSRENIFYVAIAWKLSKENYRSNFLCKKYVDKSYNDGYGFSHELMEKFHDPMTRYIALYELNDLDKNFIINYKTNVLEIQCGNIANNNNNNNQQKNNEQSQPRANSFVRITGSNIQIIKAYVNDCFCEYTKDKGSVNDEKNFYEWGGSRNREDYKWLDIRINVNKTMNNVFLELDTKDIIKKEIDAFLNAKDFYKQKGIPYKKGFIFYGEPGCGKTSSIYAIAHYCQRPIYKINLNVLDTTHEMKRAFKLIKANSIVVIEDIDSYGVTHKRQNLADSNSDDDIDSDDKIESDSDEDDDPKIKTNMNVNNANSHKSDPTESPQKQKNFSTLLEIFDGYTCLHGCIVIFTTNHIRRLDPALIRPGRIDTKIKFKFACWETIISIFKYFYEIDDETSSDVIKKLHEKQAQLKNLKISTSTIINTIIMPHIKSPDQAISRLMKEYEKQLIKNKSSKNKSSKTIKATKQQNNQNN